MRIQYSTRTLLTIIVVLSLLSAFGKRVDKQRRTVTLLNNLAGTAFHEGIELDQSFVTNARYSVTRIETPFISTSQKYIDVLRNFPGLNHVTVTLDNDPKQLKAMGNRFPQIQFRYSPQPIKQRIF